MSNENSSHATDAMYLINKYQKEGYFCNNITGKESKVLERIGANLPINEYQIFLCSKQEATLFAATRHSIAIITDNKNLVIKVGSFSDQINL